MLVERRLPKIFSIAEFASIFQVVVGVVDQHVRLQLEGFLEHLVAIGEGTAEDLSGEMLIRMPAKVVVSDETKIAVRAGV